MSGIALGLLRGGGSSRTRWVARLAAVAAGYGLVFSLIWLAILANRNSFT
ncbi:MAG: hypothetical protein WD770_03410 [Actinomycetota bacterium]